MRPELIRESVITRASFVRKPEKCPFNMSKLRQRTLETAIREHYRRREVAIDESLIEMYLDGISVRRLILL